MIYLIFILSCWCLFVSSAEIDKNVNAPCKLVNSCYQSVNTSYSDLAELIRRFENKSTDVELPKFVNYEKIENLSNEFHKIHNNYMKIIQNISDHRKLDSIDKNVTQNQREIATMLDTLKNFDISNISEFQLILKEFKQKHDYFQDTLKIGSNSSEECQRANKASQQLESVLKELSKELDKISNEYYRVKNATYNVNRDIRNVNLNIHKIDAAAIKLKIPLKAIQNYIENLQRAFNTTFTKIVDNKNILNIFIEDIDLSIKKSFEEIRKSIDKFNQDLTNIYRILQKYMEAISNLSYQIEMLPDLNQDFKELNKLKDKIAQLNEKLNELRQTFNKQLKQIKSHLEVRYDEIRRERDRIREYFYLLETIPLTDKQKHIVENELEKNDKTLKLLAEKEELQNNYDNVKQICKEIDRYKTCPPPDITVEN